MKPDTTAHDNPVGVVRGIICGLPLALVAWGIIGVVLFVIFKLAGG